MTFKKIYLPPIVFDINDAFLLGYCLVYSYSLEASMGETGHGH